MLRRFGFYQRKGLLPIPDKPHGSINRYSTESLMRLKFIKSAKQLDFSLNEIAELLVHGEVMRALMELVYLQKKN